MKAPEEKEKIIKRARSRVIIALVASLTHGLAPFFPEPHLFGKWKWLIGGVEGMQPIDWFDLALHTSPWTYLSMSLIFLVNLGKKVFEGLEIKD